MATSDLIARFILDALDEANGIAELQRATLAEQFSCVPSQINYVISTRFSPERGYIVESRRGGGGYIRITPGGDIQIHGPGQVNVKGQFKINGPGGARFPLPELPGSVCKECLKKTRAEAGGFNHREAQA